MFAHGRTSKCIHVDLGFLCMYTEGLGHVLFLALALARRSGCPPLAFFYAHAGGEWCSPCLRLSTYANDRARSCPCLRLLYSIYISRI